MSFMHICPKCKAVSKQPNTSPYPCPDCHILMYSTEITDSQWFYLSSKEKNEIKDKASSKAMTEVMEKQERYKEIIVTTGDLKQDYKVLGPVYFQVSNKGLFGSALKDLIIQYSNEIKEMKQNGTMSGHRSDWGFLYGEWSVGQNDFEAAFFIATQELKKRALMVGADAVICMRQDIDMDTNGFAFFYLQMYGTAVKFINADQS